MQLYGENPVTPPIVVINSDTRINDFAGGHQHKYMCASLEWKRLKKLKPDLKAAYRRKPHKNVSRVFELYGTYLNINAYALFDFNLPIPVIFIS